MIVLQNPAEQRLERDVGWERTISLRLVAGDAAALADVYSEFGRFVFGLALKVIRDRDEAEDVTQEVFCQLWERPDRFDVSRGSLRSFLGVITHRRAVDHVRRIEAARTRDARSAPDGTHVPTDITDAVHADLDAAHVRSAVDELPADQRAAVLLAYFGGRTFRDVAEILAIPEGTAKSRIRAALDSLSRTLNPTVVSS